MTDLFPDLKQEIDWRSRSESWERRAMQLLRVGAEAEAALLDLLALVTSGEDLGRVADLPGDHPVARSIASAEDAIEKLRAEVLGRCGHPIYFMTGIGCPRCNELRGRR